jgi:flagellar hook-length control protein FliK
MEMNIQQFLTSAGSETFEALPKAAFSGGDEKFHKIFIMRKNGLSQELLEKASIDDKIYQPDAEKDGLLNSSKIHGETKLDLIIKNPQNQSFKDETGDNPINKRLPFELLNDNVNKIKTSRDNSDGIDMSYSPFLSRSNKFSRTESVKPVGSNYTDSSLIDPGKNFHDAGNMIKIKTAQTSDLDISASSWMNRIEGMANRTLTEKDLEKGIRFLFKLLSKAAVREDLNFQSEKLKQENFFPESGQDKQKLMPLIDLMQNNRDLFQKLENYLVGGTEYQKENFASAFSLVNKIIATFGNDPVGNISSVKDGGSESCYKQGDIIDEIQGESRSYRTDQHFHGPTSVNDSSVFDKRVNIDPEALKNQLFSEDPITDTSKNYEAEKKYESSSESISTGKMPEELVSSGPQKSNNNDQQNTRDIYSNQKDVNFLFSPFKGESKSFRTDPQLHGHTNVNDSPVFDKKENIDPEALKNQLFSEDPIKDFGKTSLTNINQDQSYNPDHEHSGRQKDGSNTEQIFLPDHKPEFSENPGTENRLRDDFPKQQSRVIGAGTNNDASTQPDIQHKVNPGPIDSVSGAINTSEIDNQSENQYHAKKETAPTIQTAAGSVILNPVSKTENQNTNFISESPEKIPGYVSNSKSEIKNGLDYLRTAVEEEIIRTELKSIDTEKIKETQTNPSAAKSLAGASLVELNRNRIVESNESIIKETGEGKNEKTKDDSRSEIPSRTLAENILGKENSIQPAFQKTEPVKAEIFQGGFSRTDVENIVSEKGDTDTNVRQDHNLKTSLDKAVIDQIVKKAILEVGKGKSELKISIKPDELGALTIKVVAEGLKTRAAIVAESSMIKEIIEQNIDELRMSLSKNGLKIDAVDVSVEQDVSGRSNTREEYARHIRNMELFGRQGKSNPNGREGGNKSSTSRVKETAIDFYA